MKLADMGKLFKNVQTPSSPLEILQAEMEATIQLTVHTLSLYQRALLKLPQGKLVPTN